MKTLRNTLFTLLVMVMLNGYAQQLAELPQMTFQSTSTLQGSGSLYSSVVVTGGTYTTYDMESGYAPHRPTHARKVGEDEGFENETDPDNPSEPFPIGDGWVMLVLAAVGGGVLVLRRRKRG